MDNTGKNSILVVDDEPMNIINLTHILSSDYMVYAVKDGQDAVDYAQEYLPDVILLDILMPEMDGYAVLKSLKAIEKTRDIPVIFISGLSDKDDEEKGLSAGASDYISKPFSPAIVKLRVKNQIKITEQTHLLIEKETAARSERARGQFVSRMSHEMRTPMNAIMGLTALMKNGVENKKQADMLGKLNDASVRLMQLIDDILDLSDIEDNKLNLDLSEFRFSEMIGQITEQITPELEVKQQSFTTDIDTLIPNTVSGDKKRLIQIIMNLLSNAVKFTHEKGSITLNAFVSTAEDDTPALQFEAIDNGIGIPKERLDTIFTPFEQVDGGIDRKFGGAGLGLAISEHLVRLMGGEIWAESTPGKGSKFAFSIPLRSRIAAEDTAGQSYLNNKTVLFAEDMEINREIVMAMLEDTGMKFVCADNGREALFLFNAEPEKYDVIFMDINMPEMDGVEATRQIRTSSAPEGKTVPIIAMTANVVASEVATYLSAGMNAHVGKPVDIDKLMDILFDLLKLAPGTKEKES